ncbi:MAG: glycosyltransferase [Cyanobacteria bacterium P01_C01_bin.118]
MAIVVKEALKSAAIYQRSNQQYKAQLIYRQILEQQADQPDALLGLAMAAQDGKQYRAAKLLIHKVLEKHPNDLKAWFSWGNLCQEQGLLNEAELAYRKALALQPNSFLAYNNLGYILQQRQQWEEATECYQQALALEPRCSEAALSLASIKNSQGQLNPTEQSYYAALSNNLGFSKKQAGDLATAVAYYRMALEFSPGLAIGNYNLGVALQEGDEIAAAKSCFESIQKLATDQTVAYKEIATQKLRQLSSTKQKTVAGKPVKVAFVCQPTVMTTFPPFGKPTDSLGILTYELACLLTQNYDITVYVPGKISQEIHHGNITYIYIPVGLDNSLEKVYKDVLDISDTQPLVASDLYFEGYASAVARELKKGAYNIAHIWTFSQFASIIRQHNPEIKIVLHLGDELLSRLDSTLVEPRLNSVDCVIGCSDYITEKLKYRFSQHAHLFKTLYNGANTDIFLDGSIELEASNNTSGNRKPKRLLFVGAVSPEKGAHVLLEAFQKVSNVYPTIELTLVGPEYVLPYEFSIACNDDAKVKELLYFHEGKNWRNYIKQYSANPDSSRGIQTSKIHFTGLVPYATLSRFYQQADIFIFPSVWNEPFGMPIIEAMIAGIPVIATLGGAFPEIIEHGKTGLLVKRGDVASLADGILKLLLNDDLRRDLGKQGCHKATKLFSFWEMADNLAMIYHSLF